MTMKALDKSSATRGKTLGRRQMFMSQTQMNERGGNVLEMGMVKLPPLDIVRTCMDLNTPAEILGTCMHSDP